MRALPPDIHIDPIPPEFEVEIEDNGKVLKASVTLDGKLYEIGLRPRRNHPTEMAQALINLRRDIWLIKTLHSLGRLDLIAYASADRHKASSLFHPIQLS